MKVRLTETAVGDISEISSEVSEVIESEIEGLADKPLSRENVSLIKIDGDWIFRLKMGGRGSKVNHRALFDIIGGEVVVFAVFDRERQGYDEVDPVM